MSFVVTAIKAFAAWYAQASIYTQLAVQAAVAATATYAIGRLTQNDLTIRRQNQTTEHVLRGGTNPWTLAYGQVRIGGQLLYANATRQQKANPFRTDSDRVENPRIIYALIGHTAHEVDAFLKVYYDDVQATFHSTYHPDGDINDGTITNRNPRGTGVGGSRSADGKTVAGVLDKAGHFYNPLDAIEHSYAPSVEIASNVGNANFVGWPILRGEFTQWTAAHKCRGISQTLHAFWRFGSSDASDNYGNLDFWNRKGPPFNPLVELRGKKIYDPRRDPAQTCYSGSGSQSQTDESTWEYSQNPIIIALDYKRHYWSSQAYQKGGVAWSRFDLDLIASQADICDETVPVPGGQTQPRYCCDIVISLGETHRRNINNILQTCLGYEVKTDGKYGFRCGHGFRNATTDPSVHLVEGDFKDLQFVDSPNRQDRYNQCVVRYRSRLHNYERRESIVIRDAAAVTRDNGEELMRTLEIYGATNEYQAQRLAQHLVARSWYGGTAQLKASWKAQDTRVGGFVHITDQTRGWVIKLFRVVKVRYTIDREHPIELSLQEEDNDIWEDPSNYVSFSGTPQNVETSPNQAHEPTILGEFGLIAIFE